ncbi:hypothetical protein [Romboutsia sp.]|uniref:hypothetical protein n=1 Tax=Romboutsia sp. TaxID=1965302 RepID=UPI003F315F53
MIDKKCFANLNEYLYNGTELHLVLETADISLIKCIMTYYIIGDNLCIGMLSKALDYKIFYIALNRLLEIKMEKGSLIEN